MAEPRLVIEDIHAYYGESYVLHGVSLEVHAGEVVALLGRNGAGKTTTLKSVMGVVPPRRGRVTLEGTDITGMKPHAIARRGVSYMPETRGIFPSLSVAENLELVTRRRRGEWTLEQVYGMFPRLRERAAVGASLVSGGEQQMLAIARALLLNPALLILDEPTEGLAPIIVKEIQTCLRDLKRGGMTILLVEQSFRFATDLADDVYVLGRGRIRWHGTGQSIQGDTAVQRDWIGV